MITPGNFFIPLFRAVMDSMSRWSVGSSNISTFAPEIIILESMQRVTWAESDDNTQMIPGRTEFLTVGKPATPEELLHWLTGTTLANL